MILASTFYFVKTIFKITLLDPVPMHMAKHKLKRQNQLTLFLIQMKDT